MAIGGVQRKSTVEGDSPPLDEHAKKLVGAVALGVTLATLVGSALGNGATKIACACLGLLALHGLWRGAARMAGSLVGMVLGMLLAKPVGIALEGIVEPLTNTSGMLGRLTSITVCGLVLTLVLSVVLTIGVQRLARKLELPGIIDRMTGGVLGFAEGALIVLAVFWGLQALAPFVLPRGGSGPEFAGLTESSNGTADATRAAPAREPPPLGIARVVGNLATSARESVFAGVARATSPVSGEIMRVLEEFAAVSRDKAALGHFLESEPLRAMADDPRVLALVEKLKQDAELKGLFDQGQVTPQAMLTVMKSKTVREMLDDQSTSALLREKAGLISLALREAAAKAGKTPGIGPN